MADAKINISAVVDNGELKQLNAALADSQQSAKALKAELKQLEKETNNGRDATDKQAAALRRLQAEYNEQTQQTARYAQAIRETQKAQKESSAETDGLFGKLSNLLGAFTGGASSAGTFNAALGALSVASGELAAEITSNLAGAVKDLAAAMIDAGLEAEKIMAQFAAMPDNMNDGLETWRIFNDLTRDVNYNPEALNQMMVQLMDLGYSAQNAADLIRLCSDTAAGLGEKGPAAAQQLVDAISRIQATGEISSRQLIALKTSGIELDKAFAGIGMTGDEAMEAVKNGTLDAQTAVGALTGYLQKYQGATGEAKKNTVDMWDDVTGNINAACAEIGLAILGAFNQSEIVQTLIDFTQSLLDMIRTDGTSIFSDFGAVASYALGLVGDALEIIINIIKLVIMAGHAMYEAFRSLGAKIADALMPILSPLIQIFNILGDIVRTLGQKVSAGIGAGFSNMFPGRVSSGDNENHFKDTQRKSSNVARAGGGGGGGSGSSSGGGHSSAAAKALSEEEKAVESLIKKYADADKQKWALAKSIIATAQTNLKMMTKEAKETEGLKVTLQGLKDAHDQLLEGYANELELAAKIENIGTRNKTIKAIKDQIEAENRLYDAKVKAAEFENQYKIIKENTKSMVDRILGDPESAQYKIEEFKKTLMETLDDIDVMMANPDEEVQLAGIAGILGMTPEQLQEDLEAKGQTLEEFIEQYKETLASAADAEIQHATQAEQWRDKLKSYVTDIGKSMGSAMADFINGAKSAKDALSDFVKSIIQNAVQILTEWLGVYAIYSAFPLLRGTLSAADMANETVFGIKGKARGGLVTGPGTGTSDSIPTMLSNGEYVIRSAAVDRVGLDTLNAINAGRAPDVSGPGVSNSNTVTLNVSAMDAESFSSFLERGGLDSIRQALFDNNREFATESGVW